VERAQAISAQRRTQMAAKAAIEAKQAETLERYRQIKEAGEQRVAVAQKDLDKAQTELRQTTQALSNAQSVLADRSARLNEARSKLATLMSMTRDLLRLVKPVTEMRASARKAAEAAEARLAAASSPRAERAMPGSAKSPKRDSSAQFSPPPAPSSGPSKPLKRDLLASPSSGAGGYAQAHVVRSGTPTAAAAAVTTPTAALREPPASDISSVPEEDDQSPAQEQVDSLQARLNAFASKYHL
jgi:hypothetical protein